MDEKFIGAGEMFLPDGQSVACKYDLIQTQAQISTAHSDLIAGYHDIKGRVTTDDRGTQGALYQVSVNLQKAEKLTLHLADHGRWLDVIVTSPEGDVRGTGPLRDE